MKCTRPNACTWPVFVLVYEAMYFRYAQEKYEVEEEKSTSPHGHCMHPIQNKKKASVWKLGRQARGEQQYQHHELYTGQVFVSVQLRLDDKTHLLNLKVPERAIGIHC